MSSYPRNRTHLPWQWSILGGLAISFGLFQTIPLPRFDVPYSTLYYSAQGELLGATLAEDQRLRFPPDRNVPQRFEQALLTQIDQRFHQHPGLNPVLLGQSLIWPDDKASQACTLTQSVVRLSRRYAPQTIREYLVEGLMALRLEQSTDKEDIMRLYATHARFGADVTGVEAATWHYFAHTSEYLSWAEAATLAVLPHHLDASDHPEVSESVITKRNGLLAKLRESGTITDVTYLLATGEPLVAQRTDLKETGGLAKPDS